MNVAVTGAGGFIGSAAVPALRTAGFRVRAHLGPQEFDICDRGALRHFFEGSDVVVHLAGPPSVAESFEYPAEYERIHVDGTAAVLAAMHDAGIARIVYVSSADVYGSAGNETVKEDRALRPASPYGSAKASAERSIVAAHKQGRVTGYLVRPFSVYGPGMNDTSLVATICAQAVKTDDIFVNDLEPVRDYCFVGDLADLLVRAVARVSTEVVALNAAYGKGYSVAEVIAAVGEACGRPLVGRERGPKRDRAVEIRRLIADVSRTRSILGWQARFDLADGIRHARLLALAS